MESTTRPARPRDARSRRWSRRRRWGAATLVTGLGFTAAAALVPESASADPVGPTFATANNASDPFAFRCADSTGAEIYCMVTSQDLNQPPIGKGTGAENYYPMSSTLGFTSTDGVKWAQQIGPTLQESSIGRTGVQHLWAPTVQRIQHTVKGPANEYYLYTPDLTDSNDKYSSKIYVTYSTKPTSGYGATNLPGTSTKFAKLNGVGYMSDPEVFVDSSTPTTNPTPEYLLWADGDYASCGGMSLRAMTSQTTVQSFSDPSEAWLPIGGPIQDELGSCTKRSVGGGGGGVDTVVPRPYLEGGSIFRTANWQSSKTHSLPGPYIMVFAAKPGDRDGDGVEDVPAQCQQPGQPNSANEVIAYATAPSATGPYTYQGIIMCGSDSEWTNQATIEEVNQGGAWRLVLVYHDGVVSNQDTRNRKLHSDCLLTDGHGKFLLTSRSPEGAASTAGAAQWCLQANAPSTIYALQSVSTGQYVTSRGDSGLVANGSYIGLWEQYRWIFPDKLNVTYVLARNPGNLWVQVQRNAGGEPVIARGASSGSWEGMQVENVDNNGTVRIHDTQSPPHYWRADSAGNVTADTTNPSPSDPSYQFRRSALW